MARMLGLGGLAGTLLVLSGCAIGPASPNPMAIRATGPDLENPMFIPPGQTQQGYELVFNKIYDVVHQDFEIASSNRFAGRIDTHWLNSAGYADFPRRWLHGHYENTEAMLQSVRRRVEIEIAEAEVGGYTVRIRVFKELEDLPQPAHGAAGPAVFRYELPLERQFDVITDFAPSCGWIPYGRDHCYEQVLLAKIRCAL